MRRVPAGPGPQRRWTKSISSDAAQPPSGSNTYDVYGAARGLRPPCRRRRAPREDFFRSRSRPAPPHSALRCAPAKDSMLPSAPRTGEKVRCSTSSPLACIAPMTLSITSRCTPASLTTPLGPPPRPGLELGFDQAYEMSAGFHQRNHRGENFLQRDESHVNDDPVHRLGQIAGFQVAGVGPLITTTRWIVAQPPVKLSIAHVQRVQYGNVPRCSKQSVKPPWTRPRPARPLLRDSSRTTLTLSPVSGRRG